MVNRVYSDYIQDILDSIQDVENFIQGMSFDDFKDDRKTINALVRSIEIIGEASKKIPKRLRDTQPEIPWKKMAGMRDKLTHAYFGIDLEIIWKVASEEIKQIETGILEIQDNLQE
jgi:uncharacterized protein with HEPN domain